MSQIIDRDKKPSFKKTVETAIVEKLLREKPIEEVVTYQEMSEAIDGNIIARRWILDSARRILLKDGLVFEVIPKVGLKRLNSSEIVELSEHDLKRQRRAAKKAHRKLSCVKWEDLNDGEKIIHNSRMAVMAAIELFAKPSKLTQLTTAIETAMPSGSLPINRTLKLFITNGEE